MEKIIKYGFQPVVNNRVHGQNSIKGQNLYNSGHVYDIVEHNLDGQVIITGKVVPQTSMSKVYNVIIDGTQDGTK